MSSFTTPLISEHIDGYNYRVVEAFTYCVGDLESGEFITVPAGFICDGQSFPRLLRFVDTPTGRGGKAGFIHDYLYWLNGRPVPETGKEYNRKQSDLIFKEALAVSGVNAFSCRVRYRTLRICGGLAWRNHRRRIERELEQKFPNDLLPR